MKKLLACVFLLTALVAAEERAFDDNSGSVFSSLTRVNRLRNQEITKLDLSCDQDLTDISFLRFFPHLTELNLSNNHQLEDLTPLKYCTKLEKLNLYYLNVKSTKPLLPLVNLVSLTITSDNAGNAARYLKRLPNLIKLDYSGSVEGIEKIGQLTNLKKLSLRGVFTDCYDNDREEFPTLAFLSSLINLTDLDLSSNNYIIDINPISKLLSLKRLNLSSNLGIEKEKLKVLAKMPKLKKLIISSAPKNFQFPERIKVIHPHL